MTVEAWIAFASLVGTMLGGYAAIKSDLAMTRERATNAHDSAKRAHERIDQLQNNHQ